MEYGVDFARMKIANNCKEIDARRPDYSEYYK